MKREQITYFFLLSVVAISVYLPVLRDGKVLNIDDTGVYTPMTRVTSVKDYLDKMDSGAIVDRQPVRDLSFFIDTKLAHLGWRPHWTNLLIFLGILYYLICVGGSLAGAPWLRK